MTEEMGCLHNFNDGICKTCGAIVPITDAQNPLRQKAIKILEAIAVKLGDESLFDHKSFAGKLAIHEMDEIPEPDGTWYEYEDLVTEILAEK